jgi:hypothetical protein
MQRVRLAGQQTGCEIEAKGMTPVAHTGGCQSRPIEICTGGGEVAPIFDQVQSDTRTGRERIPDPSLNECGRNDIDASVQDRRCRTACLMRRRIGKKGAERDTDSSGQETARAAHGIIDLHVMQPLRPSVQPVPFATAPMLCRRVKLRRASGRNISRG